MKNSEFPNYLDGITRKKRLLQNHDTLFQWIQMFINLGVVSTTLIALAYWRDGFVGDQYRTMLAFALFLMTIIYNIMGVTRRFDGMEGALKHITRAWGVVVIILAWTAFLTKTSEEYSRQVVVYWIFTAYLGQAAALLVLQVCLRIYRKKYRRQIPAIVVGVGNLATHLATSISRNIWLKDNVVGVVALSSEDEGKWQNDNIPLLGNISALNQIVSGHGIRRIYLALPLAETQQIKKVHDEIVDENVDLVWAPDIFEFQLLNHSVREIAGVPLLNLNETPLMAGGPAFIKGFMDRVIAAGAIITLAPLLVSLALAVRLSSPGPIFFKQKRDGWDGKKFNVYKFRSMYIHQEGEIVQQAKKNDDRITPVGRILRKTSLDELPQLFNVLQGSMSLVGPRPHAESHNVYYSTKVKSYIARHRIKPGITGLAQINGCRGETPRLEDMAERVACDLEYIRNWSPWLDLKILFLTPLRLFSRSGNAY